MKVGYKQTPLGEIPISWSIKKLSSLANKERHSFTDGDWIESPYIRDSGIRLVQTGNIGDGIFRGKNQKFISEEDFITLKCKEIFEGDILICRLAEPIGRACILPRLNERAITSVDVTIFRPDISQIDKVFIKELINFQPNRKRIESLSGGSTRQRINRTNLGNLELAIPPLSEQQKIAEILSTVDEKIEVIDAQIAQTQELKKGLMQRLLTKGIGHSKFKPSPLGDIPESWEIVKVGNVIKLQGGYAFKSTDSQPEGIKWLKIANVSIGKIDWSDKSFLPFGFKKEYPSFVLKEGNIVIAMTRPLLGSLFKIAKISKADEGSLLNQRVGRVICTEKIDREFIYQVFNSPTFIAKLQKELLGTDPPNISSFMFEGLEIMLPPIEEQEKIAEILSTIDEKLNILLEKKTQYRGLKKGLMQQLLTGKLRVNTVVAEPELA